MNLQLDHLPKYDNNKLEVLNPRMMYSHLNYNLRIDASAFSLLAAARLYCTLQYLSVARPSQRVAMDDLASYFVEERSKVR